MFPRAWYLHIPTGYVVAIPNAPDVRIGVSKIMYLFLFPHVSYLLRIIFSKMEFEMKHNLSRCCKALMLRVKNNSEKKSHVNRKIGGSVSDATEQVSKCILIALRRDSLPLLLLLHKHPLFALLNRHQKAI